MCKFSTYCFSGIQLRQTRGKIFFGQCIVAFQIVSKKRVVLGHSMLSSVCTYFVPGTVLNTRKHCFISLGYRECDLTEFFPGPFAHVASFVLQRATLGLHALRGPSVCSSSAFCILWQFGAFEQNVSSA